MKFRQFGFSMIELMVTVAVVAITAAVAGPSFVDLIARQRLKGAGSELYDNLQYARSEAVQRNTTVRVTFDTVSWCYIIHTVVAGTTCTCNSTIGTCTGTAVNLKNVSGSDVTGVTTALSTGTTVSFEPRQGMLTEASAVNITFTGHNSMQLQTQVNLLGRPALCSPSGSVKGYPSC